MRLLLASITFALYFPIFILPILGYTGIRIFNPLMYSAILLFTLITIDFASSIIRNRNVLSLRIMNPMHKQLLLFEAYMIFIIYLKGAIDSSYKEAYQISLSIVVSFFILIYSYTRGYGRKFISVFDRLSLILGIFLSIQVLLSIYESITGAYFPSLFQNIATDISQRDILSVFGLSQFKLFGFQVGLHGLLFQANVFGSMLVFYNIVFLFRYFESKKRIFLFFLLLCLFTSIGNTTRFAIFTILISDLIVFSVIYKDVRVRFFTISGIFILSILYLNQLLIRWHFFFENTNTIQLRLDLWKYLLEIRIPEMSFIEKLFGCNLNDYLNFAIGFARKVSMENAYFNRFALSGFIGLVLYLWTFHVYLILMSRKSSDIRKLECSLIVICVILVSIFSATIFHFSNFIILTLLILKVGENQQSKYQY